MMKNSFRDHASGVLKSWGYAQENGNDIAREEDDDFSLEPGKWRLVGDEWQPYEDKNAAIQAQIDQMERESMLNRGSRELQLFLMEERAAQVAAARGVPVESILSKNIYYTKLKPLDDQISALREQIK